MSPNNRKCSIIGCGANSRQNKNLKFFNFPARDNPVYGIWIRLCHDSKDVIQSLRRPYICSKHFYPWQIGNRRLANKGVPSLLLKAPSGLVKKEKAPDKNDLDSDENFITKEEMNNLLEEEKKKLQSRKSFQHRPPKISKVTKNMKLKNNTIKKPFKEALEDYYGVSEKSNSSADLDVKAEKVDVVDLSQDDDGCFDVYSEDSEPMVVSQPIVENYEQALEHLKPLEDFALRQENYRVIGLLSTLEIIFQNQGSSKT